MNDHFQGKNPSEHIVNTISKGIIFSNEPHKKIDDRPSNLFIRIIFFISLITMCELQLHLTHININILPLYTWIKLGVICLIGLYIELSKRQRLMRYKQLSKMDNTHHPDRDAIIRNVYEDRGFKEPLLSQIVSTLKKTKTNDINQIIKKSIDKHIKSKNTQTNIPMILLACFLTVLSDVFILYCATSQLSSLSTILTFYTIVLFGFSIYLFNILFDTQNERLSENLWFIATTVSILIILQIIATYVFSSLTFGVV
ncbi:hypothetical protein N9N03_01430 [Chlamydiia bacterium]|nr:hypothetical protein [Chlamydiia bacterium]